MAIFFLMSCFAGFSQDTSSIDSLKKIIEADKGLLRYESQLSLARLYANHDYNNSLPLVKDAYEYAVSIKDTFRIVQSGRMYGQVLVFVDRWNEALPILYEVLPIAEKKRFTEELGKVYSNLAIAKNFRSEYDQSLTLHFKSLALIENGSDYSYIGYAYSNIGAVYFRMKNYDEALRYNLKAIDVMLAAKETHELEKIYLAVGLCYNHLKRYDEAQKYFDECLSLCDNNCSDVILYSLNTGMGISNMSIGKFQEADLYLTKANNIVLQATNARWSAEIMYLMARLDLKRQSVSNAKEKFLEAEKLCLKGNYREFLASCYRDLAEIYEKEHDFNSSATYLKKYIVLKDSIYSKDVIENLSKVKSEFEQRENVATIKERESTIAQQRRFNYAVVVIAIMAVMFVGFLFRSNRMMTMMNRKLTEAQDLIFEQNKRLEMRNRELDHLVEKKTEELKLVNLSLKQMNDELDTFINKTADDIRAPLASLKGICNVALKDIQDSAPLVYLNRINSTTESLNSILKRLLALNKINQSKISVSEIDLRTLVDNVLAVQQKKGIPQNLVIRKNIESNMPVRTDRELLSIVLENSIDNAVKYCRNSPKADHFIEISIKPAKNGRISFSVIDNGIGISEFALGELDEIFLNTSDEGSMQNDRKDLYFVKTAAKKIGGKVQIKKTVEGYNEAEYVPNFVTDKHQLNNR